MKRTLALIHASRASVDPLMRYYPEAAPELEIVNLETGKLLLFWLQNGSWGGSGAGGPSNGRGGPGCSQSRALCGAIRRPYRDSSPPAGVGRQ